MPTSLDPVTFEVLKNAFVNTVDQMAEQILRTCYSFVIYSRDFSSALCDLEGNTVMQGTGDIAAHVGTLHYTAKAVIRDFAHDMNPGDVFVINDVYEGGSHFNDTRIIRPIYYEGELLGYAQANGHWADVGGATPGSFNVKALDHMGEGLRIPPTRLWSKGEFLTDVAYLIAKNTRNPRDIIGDMQAQAESTKVAEREIQRLCDKYGVATVKTAMAEVQDYVEELTRAKIAALPDGTWYTEDYIDQDPALDEGLIPVTMKMTIEGDRVHYDLSESHASISSMLNAGFGGSFAGIVAGTKMQFPDIPLNSGFYRVVTADLGPIGSVVNAEWPRPCAGFCSGPFEKIMNSVFEIWSDIQPDRAMAATFNLEYLLVGGKDQRLEGAPNFMWYDWMMGGWGARNGADGYNAAAPIFGVQYGTQPFEGQERLAPVLTTCHDLVPDSGGPGRFRGGLGAEKGGHLWASDNTVMSYCCDRERSVTWGLWGGLPSIPHGVWLNKGTSDEQYLGGIFAAVPIKSGDKFTRPSAGGGGLGDPLQREPEAVLEDVIEGYVTIGRAEKDYGVVINAVDPEIFHYEIDGPATEKAREYIRGNRQEWMKRDPHAVAEEYQQNLVNEMDCVRQYGVILDWGAGEVLEETTRQFRDMLARRTIVHWTDDPEVPFVEGTLRDHPSAIAAAV